MPTQKDTWDSLQQTKQPNVCGRPGVNGGFLEDDSLKYGANCFGVKPPEPVDYTYDDSLANIPKRPAKAPATAKPTPEELMRAAAKMNAFNNLKHEWSQY